MESVRLYDDAWQGFTIGIVAVEHFIGAGEIHPDETGLVALVFCQILYGPRIHHVGTLCERQMDGAAYGCIYMIQNPGVYNLALCSLCVLEALCRQFFLLGPEIVNQFENRR